MKTYRLIIIEAYLLFHAAVFFLSIGEWLIETVLWAAIVLAEFALLAYCCHRKESLSARRISAVLCAELLLNSFASGVILYLGNDPIDEGRVDTAIVLGHGLINNEMSDTLKMRLDRTLSLVRDNENCTIIVTGGVMKNNNISEASLMKQYLVENGISEDRIIEEDKARDTIENIRYSAQYIEPDDEVVLISSRYHCFRAKMAAEYYGIKAKACGTEFPLLYVANKMLHEKLGIAKFVLYYFLGLL